MARNFLDIKLDVSKVKELESKLAAIDSKELGDALVETLNEVTTDAYDMSRKSILRGINLDKSYVEEKFEVKPATSSKPESTIVAKGTLTNISHYGAVRFSQNVKHPERAKGDPGRGYVKGQKADGMAAEVTRGSAQSIGKKFVIPGIKDSAGNLIVFRGTGKAGSPKNPKDKGRRKTPRQGVEAVLGPSVYQLFRFTADKLQTEIADNLERAIVERAEKEFLKAIE